MFANLLQSWRRHVTNTPIEYHILQPHVSTFARQKYLVVLEKEIEKVLDNFHSIRDIEGKQNKIFCSVFMAKVPGWMEEVKSEINLLTMFAPTF
jgi:hypothetical protein